MATKKMTAHDAWWFLYYHPAFQCPQRILAKGVTGKLTGSRKRKLKDEFTGDKVDVIELKHLTQHAVCANLDIFFTKVNDKCVVDDDKTKNVNIECWLEFGTIEWVVSNGHIFLQNSHDWRLDCGAPTFDEALVKLAKLVRRKYGGYQPRRV